MSGFMNTQYLSRRSLWLVLLATLFVTAVSQAADNVVVGNLTSVSTGSLSVRLSDGRVMSVRLHKSGELAAKAIASRYKLGEKIEITCKNIDLYIDKDTESFVLLELKKIRSVGPASPDDMALVLAVLSWRLGTNLLNVPPLPVHNEPTGDSSELERIRKTNLNIARVLPNFAASEKALRFWRGKGSSAWQLQDTVESELIYQGVHATRQNVRINGKQSRPRNGSSYWLPGINWWIGWEIGFGSELRPLFDPQCANRFSPGGSVESRGRQLVAYTFQAPADGCFGPDDVGGALYNPARSGRVLVDKDGDRIVQFEMSGGDPPPFGGGGDWKQVLTWDDVKTANSSHRLPVTGDYSFTYPNGDAWRVEVTYTNHRVFETSTNLSFSGEASGERK
jgi:hypothetical protein